MNVLCSSRKSLIVCFIAINLCCFSENINSFAVFTFADGLSSLLQEMGRAYQALASYDCHKALEHFSSLPPRHYNTGWVLVHVAKAHFELAQYQKVTAADAALHF